MVLSFITYTIINVVDDKDIEPLQRAIRFRRLSQLISYRPQNLVR